MKDFHKILCVVIIITLSYSSSLLAQERCGTVDYSNILQRKNSHLEDTNDFEAWLTRKMANRQSQIATQRATFQIPVVVHVIHRGESVGVGVNISDDQIRSQINVLNKDFNRQNSDAANTPSEFLPVAGNANIEFVLAKQDPDGLRTNGIVRREGVKDIWTIDDNDNLKATSYWPAEDYLNLWVTDLNGGLLGYAQFPISTLPGLAGAENNRLTDGVVVDFRAFGSVDDGAFNLFDNFSKGRATTHEVGHFLGLRHIWGDYEGCGGVGDYVNDTPDQFDKTDGCPAHPYTTCDSHTMFQNYMDYTNDNCMNLFTHGQVARMETVLSNSVRRASLLNSHGLIDPQPVPNDIAIHKIRTPEVWECNDNVSPATAIRNNGTNAVSQASIALLRDNVVIETKTFTFNPPLQVNDTIDVAFSYITLSAGEHSVVFRILQTNGGNDGKELGNEREIITTIPHRASLPLSEDFNTLPAMWTLRNPDGDVTWNIRETNSSSEATNSVHVNFYNYRNADGEEDVLMTPVLNLSDVTRPYLTFDVAYATFQQKDDGLKIIALSNCANFSEGTVIYSKSGSSLATVATMNQAFVPTTTAQWRKERVDLRDFAGQQNIRLAFVSHNDNGNNLYLDNVLVTADDLPAPPDLDPYNIYYTTDGRSQLFISFNLDRRQSIRYELIGVMGNIVSTREITNVLNETIEVVDADSSPGIYILRLFVNQRYYAARVYLN